MSQKFWENSETHTDEVNREGTESPVAPLKTPEPPAPGGRESCWDRGSWPAPRPAGVAPHWGRARQVQTVTPGTQGAPLGPPPRPGADAHGRFSRGLWAPRRTPTWCLGPAPLETRTEKSSAPALEGKAWSGHARPLQQTRIKIDLSSEKVVPQGS